LVSGAGAYLENDVLFALLSSITIRKSTFSKTRLMILDIIFVIILVLAIIKGFRRGLIVGIFSLLAVVIGLAAAMKLSTVAAGYLGDAVSISDRWLPILSFAVVFIAVVLLIRLGANAIEKAVQAVTLGWLNRLGGILLYLAIYITIFSVVLFYLDQAGIIRQQTIERSVTYSFVQPWGPAVINGMGTFIPFFRDMFGELEQFFEGVSRDIPRR
jgi:membrane protein required for colicin V production